MRRFSVLGAILAVAAVTFAFTASPALPSSSGTVSLQNPSYTWTGNTMTNAYVAPLEGVDCPSAATDPQNAVCDHAFVTVDVPDGHWKNHHGYLRIVLKQGTLASVLLFVYDPNGMLVGEANSDGNPTATIFNPKGTYEVRVAPEVDFADGYVGTATLSSANGKDPGFPLSGFSAYHVVTSKKLPSHRLSNKAIPYRGKKLVLAPHYVGRKSAEPTLGMGTQDAVFFAAGAFDAVPSKSSPKQEPRTLIMRSIDHGRSWTVTQPPFVTGNSSDGSTTTNGEPVTLDPYVYVEPDSGRVFMIDLKGTSSAIDHSDDSGQTWTQSQATSPGVNDHQTVYAAPVPKGSPLVTTDKAFPKILYYCVNQVSSANCARSLDGGMTFQNTGTPAYYGAEPTSQNICGSLHGHIRSDSDGRIFLPRGECGKPLVSISSDAGTTWSQVQVADSSFNDPDQTTSISSDSEGNLYYVFFDGVYYQPWLTVSRDHGATWGTPMMIAPPGVRETNFPVIAAGDPGHVAIMFPGTTGSDRTDMSRPWNSYIVESTDALSAKPTFISNIANPGGAKDPIHRGFCTRRCGRMYDFLDIHIAPNATGTVIASAVDTCTDVSQCNTVRYAGASQILLGSFQGVSSDMQGVFVMQVSGPHMRTHPAKNT